MINLVENLREYETYSYLYDKDQDLLKGEKEALLKYMRKEVVQNEEFLQRIGELEYEKELLEDENRGARQRVQELTMALQRM